jgi:hypothetical protein
MDAFERELTGRLPLAVAALEMFDFAFDRRLLDDVYERHRGRCYTDALEFPDLVALVRRCLLEHGGSGHRACVEARRAGTLGVDESSFYRKLANAPVAVSRALLRRCTARLTGLVDAPRADLLPACFDALEPVVLDGKKVKRAARRLKPTRGYKGALLGAKALVAMPLRTGLAVAMSDSLDGEANDVPLVPELLPQVREVIPGPILWVADRQFGGLGVPPQLTARVGDHFVLRVSRATTFTPDPARPARHTRDADGRAVADEVGTLGKGPRALRVRRVTLRRPGADGGGDVVLVTDLLDHRAHPAADLLKLYRRRWGIERMFQQVTQTFALDHLIGCSPRAVLFQFALCLLMYNLAQVLRRYVAADGRVDAEAVSTHALFYDLRRELAAWSYLGLPAPAAGAIPRGDPAAMRGRLAALLAGSWDAVAYPKAVDKKPRAKPPDRRSLHGGHTSVQRLLDGRVKVRATRAKR